MAKEDRMIEARKEYSAKKVTYAKMVVDVMVKNKEAVTPYTVWKKSHLSKNFIYNNPEVKAYIARHRTRKSKYNLRKMSKDDTFFVDDAVKERIAHLEKTNAALRKELNFYKKTTLENLKNENQILQYQLNECRMVEEILRQTIKDLEAKLKDNNS